MSNYQLSIITPNGNVFDGQINSLIATGNSGSFGVLGQHAPMVISLKSGPLTVKQDGKDNYFAVSSGILEVNEQSNCLLLADHAVQVETLEKAKTNVNNFKNE